MKNLKLKNLFTLLVSMVFSVALMFAFTEIPRLLDTLIQEKAGFPGADPGSSEQAAYQMELFISSTGLRWIGYGSLLLITGLIVLGFVKRKSSIAIGGAIVAFLPVFGGFALSMFYLAGLGLLRSGLLPFMDIAPKTIEMGDIIYLPYWLLIRFFFLFDYFAHKLLVWTFMSTGALIFTWSVFTWMQTRTGGRKVATGFLYRFSRHPQYLGWIIWSYGYFIYSCALNQMKKSWWIDPTLSWLFMTMLIISICMLEELNMSARYGTEYENYRKKTPFLFPIPSWLKVLLKAPGKLVTRNEYPRKRREIALIITIYTIILMLISIPFLNVTTYGYPTFFNKSRIENYSIEDIVELIKKEPQRRNLSAYFNYFEPYGENALEPLKKFISDPDPVKREFASNLLGRINTPESQATLLAALGDSISRVNSNIIYALGNLGMSSSVQPILNFIEEFGEGAVNKNAIISNLGRLGSENGWDYLFKNLYDTIWYNRTATLRGLNNINPDHALPYIYEALSDQDLNVRRAAVTILLEQKPEGAIPYLEKLTNDEDFETRFYAKQAIKEIKKKQIN